MPSTKQVKHRAYTRTGCKTCKIRKVKCDETKPQCQRCLGRGRTCDGYVEVATERGKTGFFTFVNYLNHGPSLSEALFLQDTRQRRAFEFYQLRSSLELCGPFQEETEVWNRLLLQAAYHEPAIRHAVCALGGFHQEYEDEALHASGFLRTALEQYSSAIKALVAANEDLRCMEVTLIACIVFTFCELLQGHLGSAKAHVYSGLKLLDTYRAVSSELDRVGVSNANQQRPYFPLSILTILFRRLERQLAEIGQQTVHIARHSLGGPPPHLPDRFQSIAAATESLEIIVDRLTGVTLEATTKQLDRSSSEMAVIRDTWYLPLSQQLDHWKKAFDRIVSPDSIRSPAQANHHREAALILRLWYLVSCLFLLLDSPNEVMDYDRCMPVFQSMVDVAEELLHVQNAGGHESTSSTTKPRKRKKTTAPIIEAFVGLKPKCDPCELERVEDNDFGTLRPSYFSRLPILSKAVFTCTALSPVPPVFLIATRCREPKLRRQALQILSKFNRRDGFWDSNLAAVCAEAILYSEELHTTDLHDQRGKGGILMETGSAQQIPVTARIYGIQPQFGEGRSLTLEFLKRHRRPRLSSIRK
ncbi:hypothetical protein AYO21_01296 [Fonsecaea monophora]|uniref:Zn(2)-C6 fungal-type domain-containing protein n=1 Tax=Fonsecaea monophora TaxID=254056 RepID=A0A177FL30_9EURO|nr:hypothetical protein AYO21_01296 [Fonsecaea monophora]KAH0846037.1 hypothetical protein FOPE_11391 [Fonsecaea pedrosoi]OAG44300.1 hypothetical protein AYO21_01296 [Fonsecaea monophora]